MEGQMENRQMCRLCMENETFYGGVLVEIFSELINEPGKLDLSEKILKLFGLKISPNDGLPSLICHKCLVSIDNCFEFRDKVIKNDQKLRIIFKITSHGTQQPEAVEELEDMEEDECEEEMEGEIIILNPNKLYESSSESSEEEEEELEQNSRPSSFFVPPPITQARVPSVPPVARQLIGSDNYKREIYHCRYCDVVFVDLAECTAHEIRNHDPQYPFECVICQYKTETHNSLISHIKISHSQDKPHVCSQCKKNFIRRADLRKHTFVHAGIRLYSCEICKKSFTHKTNLNKHKRTHSSAEPVKTCKCKLCPLAFFNQSDLSSHLEIHMNKSAFICKHCNQAFLERDEHEIHLKSHFDSQHAHTSGQIQPQVQMPHQSSVGFYNQIVQEQSNHGAPSTHFNSNIDAPVMNFYTESTQRHNFPIINQLLSGITPPEVQIKKFVCGICNSTFNKKKEHDRHVMTIHTNLRQFSCEKCSKTFNRKDKLLQHERTHVMPTIFNCLLCPAVFVRQQMLDMHMKAHQFPNDGETASSHIEQFLGSLNTSNSQVSSENNDVKLQPLNSNDLKQPNSPINLEVTKNDQRYLPIENVTIESDDEGDDKNLKIVEDCRKNSTMTSKNFDVLPKLKPINHDNQHSISNNNDDSNSKHHDNDDGVADVFPMTSKIADMADKIEPLHDLPIEILNND